MIFEQPLNNIPQYGLYYEFWAINSYFEVWITKNWAGFQCRGYCNTWASFTLITELLKFSDYYYYYYYYFPMKDNKESDDIYIICWNGILKIN